MNQLKAVGNCEFLCSDGSYRQHLFRFRMSRKAQKSAEKLSSVYFRLFFGNILLKSGPASRPAPPAGRTKQTEFGFTLSGAGGAGFFGNLGSSGAPEMRFRRYPGGSRPAGLECHLRPYTAIYSCHGFKKQAATIHGHTRPYTAVLP